MAVLGCWVVGLGGIGTRAADWLARVTCWSPLADNGGHESITSRVAIQPLIGTIASVLEPYPALEQSTHSAFLPLFLSLGMQGWYVPVKIARGHIVFRAIAFNDALHFVKF